MASDRRRRGVPPLLVMAAGIGALIPLGFAAAAALGAWQALSRIQGIAIVLTVVLLIDAAHVRLARRERTSISFESVRALAALAFGPASLLVTRTYQLSWTPWIWIPAWCAVAAPFVVTPRRLGRARTALCIAPSVLVLVLVALAQERQVSDGVVVRFALSAPGGSPGDWPESVVDLLTICAADEGAFEGDPTRLREPRSVSVSLSSASDGVANVARIREADSEHAVGPRLRASGFWSGHGSIELRYPFIDANRSRFATAEINDHHEVSLTPDGWSRLRVRGRVLSDGRAVALDVELDGHPLEDPHRSR